MLTHMKPHALAILYPTLSALFFGITLHTRHQHRRYCLLLPLVIFSILSLNSARDLGLPIGFRTLWTHGVLLYILHATSLLYIERWPAPGNANLRGWTLWKWRASTTWRLWMNFRMIEPGIRKREFDLQAQKAKTTQSTTVFLFLMAVKLPIYYFLHVHLTPTITEELLGSISSNDLGPDKRRMFNDFVDMTARDVVIRTYYSLYWMWESFVWLDSFHSALAIASIAIGINRPEDWPPLFGLSLQATNLRRFWSWFWHKLIARSGTNYGRVIAVHVFGLRPGCDAYDALVAFVVYGLSGLIHSIVAWQHRSKPWHLDLWWFLLNCACGIVEKKLLQLSRTLAKQIGMAQELRKIEQSWFGYLMGYVWVLGFFFWTVPFWQYPRLEQHALKVERWTAYTKRLRDIQESRERVLKA